MLRRIAPPASPDTAIAIADRPHRVREAQDRPCREAVVGPVEGDDGVVEGDSAEWDAEHEVGDAGAVAGCRVGDHQAVVEYQRGSSPAARRM